MSFLLILIIFLCFFFFFSNSQCCSRSLSMVVSEKLLLSLSVGRAIRISHSCQRPFWDRGAGGCLLGGTNLQLKAQQEARHGAQLSQCKVWGSCASCPQLWTLPATISFNHCSWHGTLWWCSANPGQGGRAPSGKISVALPNRSWQLSIYFHVILFTWNLHYTRCECMLYLFVVRNPMPGRGRKETHFT